MNINPSQITEDQKYSITVSWIMKQFKERIAKIYKKSIEQDKSQQKTKDEQELKRYIDKLNQLKAEKKVPL